MKIVKRTLDELGYVRRGKSKHRPRDASHLYDGPYPFIQTGDVKNAGLYIKNYTQTYSLAGLAQSKLWESGTLCITIAANIADTSILSFDACFPDSIIGFIPDPNKSDARYIKYLFDAVLKPRFMNFSQGATQDNLSQEKLLSLKLSIVEDVNEQRKIADNISIYDNLIDINRRQIHLLEESARLLFREWFVYFRFPGHEKVKIINGVPKGWKKMKIIEVVEVMSGGTPKTTIPNFWGGEIPFYTPKDSVDEFYVLDTEKHLTELGLKNCNSKLFPKDTIFLTARGTVGKLNLCKQPMAMNQSCYALAGRKDIPQKFLLCSLCEVTKDFKKYALGAVFDAITINTFKLLSFTIPEIRLIRLFETIMTPTFHQIENLLQQNQKLAQARDLLLPRLMSGAIMV